MQSLSRLAGTALSARSSLWLKRLHYTTPPRVRAKCHTTAQLTQIDRRGSKVVFSITNRSPGTAQSYRMTEPYFTKLHSLDLHATETRRRQHDDFDRNDFVRIFLLAFALTAFVAICRTVYISATLGLSWRQFAHAPLAIALFIPALYFTFVRFRPILSSLLGAIGLAVLATTLAWQTSTLVIHTGRYFPFVDELLSTADNFIGFNWAATLRYFDRYAYLDPLWQAAYNSIHWQPGFIIVTLALTRQRHRPFQFVIAMTLALSITNIAAIFWPALGPYEFFRITGADHANISLITEAKMTIGIQWLRADAPVEPMPHFDVGLISFPSFHAAAAALYIWALWRTPVVKWLGLVANTFMLIATPVHGSHYMIDIFGGLAVALVSVPMSYWLLGRMSNRQRRSHETSGGEAYLPKGGLVRPTP